MAIQSPSSSSSFSYGFKYQVFLSFRGIDTRHGFTGNLYKALIDKGIHTFIDDNDLLRGDEITPSLVKAIEESRIFIPIFSANYASSSFCLDELVHIIHCYKTKGCSVLPVFYGVDPTHIRHQTGSYGEHLTKHEKKFQNNKENMQRLEQWKMALTKAANLSGYHCSQGYEYKFIENIVKDISDKINRVFLHVAKYPVGLESRVQQVKLLLDKGSKDEVLMVGLYGTGGMGKSTLAKAIYNFVADQFEGVCFLHNVRENSAHNNLKHLQEELLSKTVRVNIKLGDVSEGIPIIKERLSRKKILLILDDVDKLEQLEALAGGLDWFGCGSRVIITTRDKHLLNCHGIEITYAVKGLYGTEALELLRWMAFRDNVPSGYEEILSRAVSYASGLPLVIEVVASNLFGKSIEKWKSTLDGYEKIPNKKIQEILKVSYDDLEEEEQSVFLDIACFFKGCRLSEVEETLLAHYGHCIKHHVGVLVEKSLIEINTQSHRSYNDDVALHDLIEDMGKEIVRQESSKEPGERSRLWCHNDIVHVLQKDTGTSNIEMIYLNCPSMETIIDWNGKPFRKMTNLKTLIIENGRFSKGPKHLPSSLRFLKWKGCPSKSLSSCISNKEFNNMKFMTLDDCEYLTHIPNVSGLSNLEKFSFRNCANLITIHNSVGYLNKLEILDAYGCRKIVSFPPLRLPSLKEFQLSWCKSLKKFPELLCKMSNIREIQLIECLDVEEFPFPFQNLSELSDLVINRCEMLRFPRHDDKLDFIVFSNVQMLDLNNSNLSDDCLPILLKWCVNVKYLNLSKNNFKILPECLSECHLLKHLYLDKCQYLEEIRGIPQNLEHLDAVNCYSLTSSCRRMLLSQKLHEAGCTRYYFPTGAERIPDWFEHQIRGQTVSFWFRKKIPSIICILLLPGSKLIPRFNLFINGRRGDYSTDYLSSCPSYMNLSEHTFLFDLTLEETSEHFSPTSEMDNALLKNEWIHIELKLENFNLPEIEIKKLSSAQIGIHVLKEKSNTDEDMIFSSRNRKRKLDEDVNASLPQFHPAQKKHRFVEVELTETEILQQQYLALVSDMQNLVLTETKEKEHHLALVSGMHNLVLIETKEKEHCD
ncbi:putative TIR domain, P-loop containing nucleoside triphosphate hydrolase [Medicago truncatula]|uniref:Disease resistance protein (TIR-NBS-LRR class) n=1 Tax=Medicago truncatula TaxID=3880 RepID=G7KIF2_MEDTR|nr:disease resistance protein RUN1 [Medicago truncatula]AES76172.1 disease resistance protein (TIR-NBS-LRR class) [Medicago truncatula]KEH26768.1 disease resistance protein (TIR-NBS-LRR class) [Medicago truncatula]RHN52358.1 putative TIR domain, P-loop containing nucleoside triphosphate hydrolase [Medicago truncatula]